MPCSGRGASDTQAAPCRAHLYGYLYRAMSTLHIRCLRLMRSGASAVLQGDNRHPQAAILVAATSVPVPWYIHTGHEPP